MIITMSMATGEGPKEACVKKMTSIEESEPGDRSVKVR